MILDSNYNHLINHDEDEDEDDDDDDDDDDGLIFVYAWYLWDNHMIYNHDFGYHSYNALKSCKQ